MTPSRPLTKAPDLSKSIALGIQNRICDWVLHGNSSWQNTPHWIFGWPGWTPESNWTATWQEKSNGKSPSKPFVASRMTPFFHMWVQNINQKHQGSEYASNALGIVIAKEHTAFMQPLLGKACKENHIVGLRWYYNAVANDHTFYRIIK